MSEELSCVKKFKEYFNSDERSHHIRLGLAMDEIAKLKSEVDRLILENKKLELVVENKSNQLNQPKKKGRPRMTDLEIIQKGEEQSKLKIACKIKTKFIEKEMENGTSAFANSDPVFAEQVKVYFDKVKEMRENHAYAFITVNCLNEITIDKMCEQMDKFLKKKWVTECYWVFEQRHKGVPELDEKNPERGDGKHIHMCVNIKDAKRNQSEIHRETYSTFKWCVGTEQHVVVKMITESRVHYTIDYLRGYKDQKGVTPNKMLGVGQDILWRVENSLEHIYAKNPNQDFELTPQFEVEEKGKEVSSDTEDDEENPDPQPSFHCEVREDLICFDEDGDPHFRNKADENKPCSKVGKWKYG